MQYDGTNAPEVSEWLGSRGIQYPTVREVRETLSGCTETWFESYLEFLPDDWPVTIRANEVRFLPDYKRANKGDWIVFDQGCRVLSQDEFERRYEPVAQNAGV